MSGDKHTVQSVTRALVLLETLAEDGAGWRLTDLARHTGLSPSTAHRLLTTLEERRFVQYDTGRQLWSVGQQAFSVGATFGQRQALVAPALPHLRKLRDLTHETANFGILDDGEIVVMAQVESREIVRAIARTGGRASLVASAMGKAVLSACSEADAEAIIALPDRNAALIPARAAALRSEIARARTEHYATDNQEGSKGITCVASPVRNAAGDVVGAMSISGLSARLGAERLPAIGSLVAAVAAEFSATLGVGQAFGSSREPAHPPSNDEPAIPRSRDSGSARHRSSPVVR
ncbi:MAG: IclR family transcriptional regulator [Devosia sp.]|nr:IclR family transcriptional regulator [Devosia sp.]